MAITMLTPYLVFDGTAAQAIALYEKALGARTERLMHAGDIPGEKVPEAAKHRIVHAFLRVGDAALMVMDGHGDKPVAKDTNVIVSLTSTDLAETTRAFDALAQGGQVTMPLHDAFWGAKFGMLTDAFGIRWMLSCETKKA